MEEQANQSATVLQKISATGTKFQEVGGQIAGGKTHALLSDILIPFGSFSLRFVFHVLKAYLVRIGTVAGLCESFGIAVSTLYKWIHLFKEHANLLLSTIEQISRGTVPVLRLIAEIEALPSGFLQRYRFSFLQDSKRQIVVLFPD